MKKLFQMLRQCMVDGQDVVLVTIIASSGSAPRGAGARMLVNQNGRIYGTIGGGAVEYKSEQLAAEVLKEKESRLKKYRLHSNEVEDLGMVCGGDVDVYFQYISSKDSETFSVVQKAIGLFDSDEDSWIITEITEGAKCSVGIYSKGAGMYGLKLSNEALMPLISNRPVQMKIGHNEYYCEQLTSAGKVIIFGGGHIAQELVPVLSHVGFRCVVMDDRKEFADRKLFKMADEVVYGSFENIADNISITKNDYAVVVTRGHSNDYTVMEQVLRIDTRYVGMIGSKGKIAKINEKLLDAGISKEAIERVYAPIGIHIKAETPAEIAISIAAELIEVRSKK